MIPALRGENFEHLAFMIDSAPEIVCLAADPNKHLIQVPAPTRIRPMMNPPLPDLCSKQRTKSVPLKSHRFVADINAALEQQIFDLPQ